MPDLKKVTGKCYTFRGLKFYAENGFVCLHDEDTGEFFVLTRKEFLLRAQALSEEAARLRHVAAENPDKASWLSADRSELIKAIEEMIACTNEAKEQGDRTDPAVDAWFMKHRPNRKSRISLVSAADFKTALPGALPSGRDTGKYVTPDFTMGAAPNPPKKLILPGE
jgi:hypothetical protein